MTSVNAPAEWWRPAAAPQAAVATSDAVPQTRLSIWAYRALVAFAAINITAPQAIFPVLAPLRLALLAAAVAMGAYLCEVFGGQAPDTPRPRELKLGIAILAWTILTLPLSLWPGGSFQFLSDQFIKSIVIYWLLARVIRTEAQLRTILWTLTLVSVPLAYVGVSQMQSGEMQRGRIMGYASGLTSNPNDLAMMVDVILPLAVVCGMLAQRTWVKLAAFGIVGLNLICLGATYSRGGFLGLVAMLLAALVLVCRRGKWWVLGVVIVAIPITFAALPSQYTARLSTIGSVESDDTGSAQDRLAGMIAAVTYIAAHPITGAGLAQDVGALVSVQGSKANWLHVHNSYLAVGTDLGIPGLAMYLAMMFYGYRRVRRVERMAFAAGRHELSLIATGLKLSFLGLVVTLFFSPGAYNFPIFYLLGLVLALDVASGAGVTPAAPAASQRA